MKIDPKLIIIIIIAVLPYVVFLVYAVGRQMDRLYVLHENCSFCGAHKGVGEKFCGECGYMSLYDGEDDE